MPTMKIPGIGPVEKKWVYVGGAAIAGFVGYAYWNKSRVDAAESEVSDYTTDTDYAMDSGVDEYVNPGGSQAPVVEDYVTAPTTNAEWYQKALAFLVDTGFDPIESAFALGRYLARQSLTSTQANMIRAASGHLGPPPVGDYPITVTPGTPSTPTPTTPTSPAVALKAPTGLRKRDASKTSVGLSWNPVAGATSYKIYHSGSSAPVGSSQDTNGRAAGLKPLTTYHVYVRGVDKTGKTGPRSESITVKTTKYTTA